MSTHICKHVDCRRSFVDEARLSDHAESVHTFSEIERSVRDALKNTWGGEDNSYFWVADLADDWVVFEAEIGGQALGLFKVDYTLSEETGQVTLGERPTQVARKTVYVPVGS